MAADWLTLQSPETYLGYGQSTGFASQTRARYDLTHHYAATPQLPFNYWDLSGIWTVAQHAALLNEPGGRVAFEFHARDLNLVMEPRARKQADSVPRLPRWRERGRRRRDRRANRRWSPGQTSGHLGAMY